MIPASLLFAQAILIQSASVFDGTGAPPRTADVLINGAVIERVAPSIVAPAGARVIDGRGKTLLPGLHDLHTHVPYSTVGGAPADWGKNLNAYLRSGVTTLADFGTYAETFEPVRRLLGEGQWKGPRVHFATRFTTPGGHGAEGGRGDFFTNEVLTPRQAHAAMAKILPYKPDVIKVFTDGWRYATAADMTSMEEETLRAIVEDAHKAGIPVLTHTVTLAKGKIAARAGVDAIMHGIQDQPIDDELIELMKKNNVAYGPTAAVYEPRAGYINEPLLGQLLHPAALKALQARPMLAKPSAQRVRKYEFLKQNVAALHKGGVSIVAGTDAGITITGTHHGWALLREIKLLAGAGLGPLEAMKAATSNAARVLRTQAGLVASGRPADLVLIDGAPDKQIGDIDKIHAVVKGGVVVDLAALTRGIHADGPSPVVARQAVELLDDFESVSGRSRLDTRWVNSTDPGHDHTEMIYTRVVRGPGDHALSVTAKMSETGRPFGRINLPLTRGGVEPMDARAFGGISFDTRGDGAYSLQVAARSAATPFSAKFDAGPVWSRVEIPFTGFGEKWRGDDLTMLLFELARPAGAHAWLEIDNVRFTPVARALYEEERIASRKTREESYRQIQNYAAHLEKTQAQRAMRAQFAAKLGYPPPAFHEARNLRMEKIGEDAIAVYHRAWVKVAPEMEVYGLYLVPKNAQFPAPLVIAKHGGGGYPELALFKGGGNYHDMIRGAAREGYVVWSPISLMYPYGDRDAGTPIPAEVRRDMDAQFRKLGTSLMGVEVMRISRSLDAMLERPEVDRARVGMIGLSYGGFFTLYTMALDERIKVGVASCSARDRETTKAAVPEGRPVDAPAADLAAMIAPRALQLQNGLHDPGFPIDDVRRAAAEAKTHYPKDGAFEFQEFDGKHEWRGDVAWAFLRKHL
ncbi:MAG: amidohydrolase family protein [Acidobacteria bacterium]|nr:amidohydrolase family protein [Acidobacteriota bacterium]